MNIYILHFSSIYLAYRIADVSLRLSGSLISVVCRVMYGDTSSTGICCTAPVASGYPTSVEFVNIKVELNTGRRTEQQFLQQFQKNTDLGGLSPV